MEKFRLEWVEGRYAEAMEQRVRNRGNMEIGEILECEVQSPGSVWNTEQVLKCIAYS